MMITDLYHTAFIVHVVMRENVRENVPDEPSALLEDNMMIVIPLQTVFSCLSVCPSICHVLVCGWGYLMSTAY